MSQIINAFFVHYYVFMLPDDDIVRMDKNH